MKRRSMIKLAAAGLVAASAFGLSTLSYAQEVTLRLHQFLPPVATVPKHILKPWAERVEEASGGKVDARRISWIRHATVWRT